MLAHVREPSWTIRNTSICSSGARRCRGRSRRRPGARRRPLARRRNDATRRRRGPCLPPTREREHGELRLLLRGGGGSPQPWAAPRAAHRPRACSHAWKRRRDTGRARRGSPARRARSSATARPSSADLIARHTDEQERVRGGAESRPARRSRSRPGVRARSAARRTASGSPRSASQLSRSSPCLR